MTSKAQKKLNQQAAKARMLELAAEQDAARLKVAKVRKSERTRSARESWVRFQEVQELHNRPRPSLRDELQLNCSDYVSNLPDMGDLALKAAGVTVVTTVAAGVAVTAIVPAVVAVASAVGTVLVSTATVTGAVGLGGLAVNFLFGGGSNSSKD